MFLLLRIIRGIIGFIFGLQIIHLISSLTQLSGIQAASGESIYVFFTILIIKVILLIVAAFAFHGLRRFINFLHAKKFGVALPALAEKKWAL
jgi:hypothetical protein